MQKLRRIIAVLALLFVVAGMYAQMGIGLADNGDFTRGARWFTSGPVGFTENVPAAGTDAYQKRFFRYWLPEWKLEFSTRFWMRSSAQLLWLPGIALNYLFISPRVLHTVSVSLAPRLLLLLFLGLFFVWVERSDLSPGQKTALAAFGGTGLALLFVNTEYLAFFNSFYFESATYIFFLAFVASLIVLRRTGYRRAGYLLCLATLLLLTVSRPVAIYWLPFGLLFVFGVRKLWQTARLRLWYIGLVVLLTPLCFLFTKYPQPNYESGPAYHQMFLGVLTYSQNPAQQLSELGMSGAETCIGVTPYTPPGDACLAMYRSKLTLINTLSVIVREPAILLRMTEDVANSMQKPTVAGLVRRASTDPGPIPPPGFDLWSRIKQGLFPQGWALWGTLIAYAVLFLWLRRCAGIRGELAQIGLIATLALPVEMYIAIIGDGPLDLLKHLFFANILFDVATLALLGLAVIGGVRGLAALRERALASN
jgi:hypothetical protein